MKFCSLYSGSSGNCLFVAHGDTRLLVDAGVSGIRVERALLSLDELPASITGILVTHEHRDHIAGVGVLSRRFDLPIYANAKTWRSMAGDLGKIADHNVRKFENGVPFVIGDLGIEAFHISHDAADPVGYCLDDGRATVGIATDTGTVTDAMITQLCGRDLVVLESNHDKGMLESGPYPYYLKRRIAGNKGHLSNMDAGEMACMLVKSGVKDLVLAHLSHENNVPVLAYQTTQAALADQGIEVGRDVTLDVAARGERGPLYTI